jgi:hypothetical protein
MTNEEITALAQEINQFVHEDAKALGAHYFPGEQRLAVILAAKLSAPPSQPASGGVDLEKRIKKMRADGMELIAEMVKDHPSIEREGVLEVWRGYYVDWNEIIDCCVQAWPDKKHVSYSESPKELIVRIIDERDDAQKELEACRKERDEARAKAEALKLAGEELRSSLLLFGPSKQFPKPCFCDTDAGIYCVGQVGCVTCNAALNAWDKALAPKEPTK